MPNMMNELRSFMVNPPQYLSQHGMNIPQQHMKTPQDAIQYLMNTGKLSQNDYNQLQQRAQQIQGSPMFRHFFK